MGENNRSAPVRHRQKADRVHGCVACGTCLKQMTCSQKDDFQRIIPLMTDPRVAGLILATPVYFGTMTAQAKAFLDRCVLFLRTGRSGPF